MTDRSPWDWYADSCPCSHPAGECTTHPRARSTQRPPAGDWRVWAYVAGRGASKTRAGACWVQQPRPGDASRWAAGIEASHHVPDGAFASENDTNEPKFDETAIIIQNKEPVGVVASAGVDSGLDKPEELQRKAEGKR